MCHFMYFFLLGQSFGASVHQPVVQPAHHPLPAPSPVPTYVTPSVVAHSVANSGPYLKNCAADGCFNKVHYDPELGPFDYCSPPCRDRHILPQVQKKLREHSSENTAKMITYMSPPSSPSSTFNSGTSRSPVVGKTDPVSTGSAVAATADETSRFSHVSYC